MVDHRFDRVGGPECVSAIPQSRHEQWELLGTGCFLEVETVVELTGGDFEDVVETLEEGVDAFGLVTDTYALDGDTDYVDGREAEVASADGCLFSVAVFEYAGAATHCRDFIDVSFRIVGTPFFVLVECRVEIDEVREETAGSHLACEFEEIAVGVFRKIADSAFLFPDLDWKYGCRSVAYAFVGSVEYLSYDATAFGRSVGAVVDRAEYNLIAPA